MHGDDEKDHMFLVSTPGATPPLQKNPSKGSIEYTKPLAASCPLVSSVYYNLLHAGEPPLSNGFLPHLAERENSRNVWSRRLPLFGSKLLCIIHAAIVMARS